MGVNARPAMYSLLVENHTADVLEFAIVPSSNDPIIVSPFCQDSVSLAGAKRRSFYVSVRDITSEKCFREQGTEGRVHLKLKRRVRFGWKMVKNASLPYIIYSVIVRLSYLLGLC